MLAQEKEETSHGFDCHHGIDLLTKQKFILLRMFEPGWTSIPSVIWII